MNISRNFAAKLHFLLDECIPSILRDQKWFVWLPFKLLFRDKSEYFFRFKEMAQRLSKEEFLRVYKETASVHIQRGTDLNNGCIRQIQANTIGHHVLEVGCGRGVMAGILSQKHQVTACDIVINEALPARYGRVHFQKEDVEALSFADNQFDTVVCAHTLEHVQDLTTAIGELRRVAKKRVIVVLPKQRPYRYTFDLHLHFFPYAHNVVDLLRTPVGKCSYTLRNIEGDWYYEEDKSQASRP